VALILLDKSAWVRGGADLLDYGELCMCGITRMEILYSVRSADDYAALEGDLAAYRDLRIDHATVSAAEAAQRELASAGQHRVSLPDLIIGACAQQHSADVLHVDRHFDVLAETFGFRSVRLP
jgi:predicted nucleic acid-binding protein